MDFLHTPELIALKDKTRQFIAQKIIPYEGDPRETPHGPNPELRQELVSLAKNAGLLTPHASQKHGGLGLSHVAKAVIFEESGYSRLGPIAMNIHAPDEGNIHLMEQVANPAQQKRWLIPQIDGKLRSCFAMTEPAPGAGSDPSMLLTSAVKDGKDYIINGRKWFITGADGSDYVIIMARTEDGQATMFLSDMGVPGIEIERNMESMDQCFAGGHSVLRFTNLRVPEDQILGELGKGFRYAQVRLAPARLTHCMRWLGQARRAHDIALAYAQKRQAFGQRLGDHEGVGFMLADNDMDLQTARLHILHTAWLLDQGEKCNYESSRAKVICSEAEWRVVDSELLASMGAKVALASRRLEQLESLVKSIEQNGGSAKAFSLDVTNNKSVKACFDAITQWGVPSIVINNAGISVTKSLLEQTEADWDAVIDTNLKGVWLVATEAARHMVASKTGGSIINMASILGERQINGVAPYAISKAGVIQTTKTMALELARYQIRVNAILPGYVVTDLNREFLQSDLGEKLRMRIPSRRFSELSDLDGPILLLASDAGKAMSGSIIAVDGAHLVSSL